MAWASETMAHRPLEKRLPGTQRFTVSRPLLVRTVPGGSLGHGNPEPYCSRARLLRRMTDGNIGHRGALALGRALQTNRVLT